MLNCYTHVRGITCSTSARYGKVMGSMLGHGTVVIVPDARPWCLKLGQNRVIAKFNSCTNCFYFKCATLIVQVRGMPWPQKGATHHHKHLGPPVKGCTIKGLVVYYVVWLGSMIYGMGLWTRASCVGLVRCCCQDGYRAQVPQHPIYI